ncbi:glycoside hydrolase superfamily [Dactylonectria macrodidyma]|uniref:chitinase n=1 Tax=Dactylonectria macrodidyma TaxID=307937 RepID=A0A9P9JBM7_9HYPO|nr:glycoside hydrolase superfamily [Dactylonectria macrodidyma]
MVRLASLFFLSALSLCDAAGECKTVTVKSGDSCGTLAKRCGISGADFTKFNPAKGFCSTLAPGGRACCSKGKLPDIRPKPNADGTCASYTVKKGDSCATIAAKNGLKAADIHAFNKVQTWGFDSCEHLGYPLRICLSKGDPPMPAPVPNAVCGPTKPGTKPPNKAKKETLADLSPCPLNACCNIWGQCGINGDFCVKTRGKYGNPGTGPPGSNGCATNCGQDIVNNDKAPSKILSVGYYESWNMDRPCLTMKAKALANMGTSYTHMHWGFGTISKNLDVGVDDKHGQWGDFKRLKSLGIKTILSLGGWGDSTSPETYDILRKMVSPSGREHFTDSLVKFANDNGLSGVDIDWEYPGAPDIPGIPPGQKDDGKNYLAMLKLLRGKLDRSKTLSIAAPASYWYLKSFPIAEMAKYLDYIVYMTYDLHGQWDYKNKWAQPGCEAGNCLRSHVNLTETYDALSMITKAGVPSNKIVVGVSSYGRSFKMMDAGCRGPMCKYDGTVKAKPGKCTKTGGYISNAEINSIIKTGSGTKTWYDKTVDADFLVYDSTQWVSYMKESTKQSRARRWKSLNFAGTVDWAVDLQQFSEDDGCSDGRCDGGDDGNAHPATLYPAYTDNYQVPTHDYFFGGSMD